MFRWSSCNLFADCKQAVSGKIQSLRINWATLTLSFKGELGMSFFVCNSMVTQSSLRDLSMRRIASGQVTWPIGGMYQVSCVRPAHLCRQNKGGGGGWGAPEWSEPRVQRDDAAKENYLSANLKFAIRNPKFELESEAEAELEAEFERRISLQERRD